MKRSSKVSIGLTVAGALFSVAVSNAQNAGNWTTYRNDAGRAGVQKNENAITKESLAKDFKFLWKLKLGKDAGDFRSYSEPLLIFRLINAQGFKDFVTWTDSQNLYAVDSELGKMLWEKHYDVAPTPCGKSNLPMTMEPPLVINFGARRAPGTPPPVPQPLVPAAQRRIGIAAGGGGFGFKGVYVLTPDGMLHEQVITTGADYGPPVKFVPGAAGISNGLGFGSKILYTVTSAGCAGTENALYSINVSAPDYPVSSYKTKAVPQVAALGPTLGDGVAYVVTGKGSDDASAGIYANSIVALSPDGKVKDWYTAGSDLKSVTPVAFTYKDKKLLVAPGKDGSFVLLDSASLGGSDHKTALAQTAPVSKAKSDLPTALAVWQDSTGTAWVFASIAGAVEGGAKFGTTNGASSHGSIVAFKIDEEGGKMSLTPQWVSRDFVSPTPPVIANGFVVALSQGNASTHAKLFVLDTATGKELYTSGESIPTYAHMAGISVGDGHVFFVTHDNTLSSFGIGIEH